MTTASTQSTQRGRRAHKRAMLWSLAIILVGAMVAPLSGYVYVGLIDDAAAAEMDEEAQARSWKDENQNPRAETWRDARDSTEGITTARGPYVTNNFMQNGGENWRNLRNGPVAGIVPWIMALSLVAIGGFHALHGPNRLEKRSGRKVLRWRTWERGLHWFTAISFIVLAITGLSLLFGRAVLIPLFGDVGFSVWANLSKVLHNFIGPVFTAAVLVMIIAWIRHNIPNKTDLEWFRKGGGMGKQHASAGRMNGGEKVWFWFIVIGGGAVCITGLILDFPGFGQDRGIVQVANLIHATVGMFWIALAFGHIYIGTAGTEGAFEGMATGYVDEEWAREHHDLWLEELKREGRIERPEDGAGSTPPKGSGAPAGSSS
ncbi:MAG: formate dehydrogenase subunit gamma [Guyparkeria sp.]|uniref:formate dehydrogenase subunit gamma n=1 Tax=Guyparkeria sp. TaxID=2035736 RepID=UPI00397A7509